MVATQQRIDELKAEEQRLKDEARRINESRVLRGKQKEAQIARLQPKIRSVRDERRLLEIELAGASPEVIERERQFRERQRRAEQLQDVRSRQIRAGAVGIPSSIDAPPGTAREVGIAISSAEQQARERGQRLTQAARREIAEQVIQERQRPTPAPITTGTAAIRQAIAVEPAREKPLAPEPLTPTEFGGEIRAVHTLVNQERTNRANLLQNFLKPPTPTGNISEKLQNFLETRLAQAERSQDKILQEIESGRRKGLAEFEGRTERARLQLDKIGTSAALFVTRFLRPVEQAKIGQEIGQTFKNFTNRIKNQEVVFREVGQTLEKSPEIALTEAAFLAVPVPVGVARRARTVTFGAPKTVTREVARGPAKFLDVRQVTPFEVGSRTGFETFETITRGEIRQTLSGVARENKALLRGRIQAVQEGRKLKLGGGQIVRSVRDEAGRILTVQEDVLRRQATRIDRTRKTVQQTRTRQATLTRNLEREAISIGLVEQPRRARVAPQRRFFTAPEQREAIKLQRFDVGEVVTARTRQVARIQAPVREQVTLRQRRGVISERRELLGGDIRTFITLEQRASRRAFEKEFEFRRGARPPRPRGRLRDVIPRGRRGALAPPSLRQAEIREARVIDLDALFEQASQRVRRQRALVERRDIVPRARDITSRDVAAGLRRPVIDLKDLERSLVIPRRTVRARFAPITARVPLQNFQTRTVVRPREIERELQRGVQRPIARQIPRVEEVPRVAQRPVQRVVPRVTQRQQLAQRLVPRGVPRPVSRPGPLGLPPFLPPFLPPLPFGSERSRNVGQVIDLRSRFAPSLFSVITGKRASKAQQTMTLSGLELRGIPDFGRLRRRGLFSAIAGEPKIPKQLNIPTIK